MTKKEQLPAPTGHHNLILEDRSKLTLTGVTDVDCFDTSIDMMTHDQSVHGAGGADH